MRKYPVLKCNEELWNEIKPVLESFGITDFDKISFWETNCYLISNFGFVKKDEISIGNSNCHKTDNVGSLRYLVDTKEEFLSAVAKLLGKKYPMIFDGVDDYTDIPPTIAVDKRKASDMPEPIAVYDFTKTKNNIVPNDTIKKQVRKKNKIENYVVSCDPAIGESTTVVTTIPTKGNDFDKDKESMEKINIADKLRHCKQGIKLYHLMFGEVEFDNLDEDDYINIITKDKENNFSDYTVNQFGQYCSSYPDGECLLFPSKDNRDWNSFQVLEEGHRVMVSDNAQNWSLRKYYKNNYAYLFSENKITSNTWSYIVPVEDFDFNDEDITINKEKSII